MASLRQLLRDAADSSAVNPLDAFALTELGHRRVRQRRTRAVAAAAAVTVIVAAGVVASSTLGRSAQPADDENGKAPVTLTLDDAVPVSEGVDYTVFPEMNLTGSNDRRNVLGTTSDGFAIVETPVPSEPRQHQLVLQDLESGRRSVVAGSAFDTRTAGVVSAQGNAGWITWSRLSLEDLSSTMFSSDRTQDIARSIVADDDLASTSGELSSFSSSELTADDRVLVTVFGSGDGDAGSVIYAAALDGSAPPRVEIPGASIFALDGSTVTYVASDGAGFSWRQRDLITDVDTALELQLGAQCFPEELAVDESSFVVIGDCNGGRRILVASADGTLSTVIELPAGSMFPEAGVTARYVTLSGDEEDPNSYLYDVRAERLLEFSGRGRSVRMLDGDPALFEVNERADEGPGGTVVARLH